MTDGRIPATPHRVLDLGKPRQSIGFFYEPGLGVPLKGDLFAKPADVDLRDTYGWMLLKRLSGYPGVGDRVPDPDSTLSSHHP